MTSLPASIEAYLLDTGFSSTEILILKRLLEGEAMTLREIAARTGKSTGVLDQAMRKLMDKGILTREMINGHPKFVVASLKAIGAWVEDDMKEKKETMQRKHKDFEAFMSTLELDKGRPEMEYFEGEDGLKQAFLKLLDQHGDWLCYEQALMKEEEDPLHAFRADLFRKRHAKKIFARVIAPDTPLGKRYQSRDQFEHRETKLVSPDRMPVDFEKIIAGDIVACFNHTEKTACFIKYRELADTQRKLFDMLLTMQNVPSAAQGGVRIKTAAEVALEANAVMGLKEFFLSRRSVVTFFGFVLLSLSVTFGIYKYDRFLNLQRMSDKIMSIAATGVLQINPTDIDLLHEKDDFKNPVWAKVVNQLKDMRTHNADILFVYIYRQSNKSPHQLEFVSDSHSINPLANLDSDKSNDVDLNNDGKIDDADEMTWPGAAWPSPPKEAFLGLSQVTFTNNFFTDQWGSAISGYAPIRDSNGVSHGALAVDMLPSTLNKLSDSTFHPFYLFFGFFLLFIFIRFTAFSRSLMKDLGKLLKYKQSVSMSVTPITKAELREFFYGKRSIKTMIALLVAAVIFTFGIYQYTALLNFHRMQDHVRSIAATAVTQFDPRDVQALQVESDWQKPEWAKVVNRMKQIRENNDDVVFVYMFRPSKSDPNHLEFVADSHSLNPYANTDHDLTNDVDADRNGKIEAEGGDRLQWPGQTYPTPPAGAIAALKSDKATASLVFYQDQWGRFITGYAPMKDANGHLIAILAVDMRASDLDTLTMKTVFPLLYFILSLAVLILIRLSLYNKNLLQKLSKIFDSKRVLLSLLFCAVCALIGTYLFYAYTLNLLKQETGNRLKSIVATAAPTINADDLEPLRFARDMKRQEYQRVFKKLNEIRSNNQGIKWAYIHRKTETPDVLEFVADADSNYYLPFYTDFNGDGKLSNDEQNVAPGVRNISETDSEFSGFDGPAVDSDFYYDHWGVLLSAFAPIIDQSGKTVAVLGLDLDVSEVRNQMEKQFSIVGIFFFIFLFLISTKFLFTTKKQDFK